MHQTDDNRPRAKAESAVSLLRQAQSAGHAVFTTSLGLEDMVVTDLIVSNDLEIDLVTLDTGRLFPETYDLIERAQTYWQRSIRVVFPSHTDVEGIVRLHGINGFRSSVAARKQCCQVRKLEPLGRALEKAQAWVTGLRREQNHSRSLLEPVEEDTGRGLQKFNPLFDWTAADVQDYLKGSGIPVNPLHFRGYPSIGCQPCTRAIEPGEPERAGRWWWETAGNSECGLHVREQLVQEVSQ